MGGNTREILNKLREVLDSNPGGVNLGDLGRMGLTAGIAGLAGNMLGGPFGVIIGSAANAILSPKSRSQHGALADLLDNQLTDEQKTRLAQLLQSTLSGGGQSSETRAQAVRTVLGFLKDLAREGRGRCNSCY